MRQPLEPPSHVYLVGFSGSGKSTTGPRLAKRLKARFVDTDAIIERRSGMSISELFRHKGETVFRLLESELVAELSLVKTRSVIALGGGAFARKENRAFIKQTGVTVYLSCSVAQIYSRLKDHTDRPLLGKTRREKLTKIKSLLNRRLESYQLADITISTTNRSPAETVSAIVKRLKEADAYR